ncbi:MAG: DMT family transporter [Proteobacteria bacterium]|nr:DMT family transporter [Pseudomonadota bacterium]
MSTVSKSINTSTPVQGTSALILIALLAASVEPVLVRLGYRLNATPAQLWFARGIVSALVVVPITRSLKPIRKDQLRIILTVSPLLLVTALAGLMALKTIPVALSVTAMSTTPAFVAIGNQALGRDKGTPRFWLGFLCSVIGVMISVDLGSVDFRNGNIAQDYGLGIFFVFCAMISSSIYRLRLEGLTKIIEPQVASTWFFVLNGILTICLSPLCARLDEATGTASWMMGFPTSVLLIASWAGVASVVANIMFVRAVKILGSTRMSIFDLLQRPLVIVFAALILGEHVTMIQVLGFSMVVLGVRLAKVTRKINQIV